MSNEITLRGNEVSLIARNGAEVEDYVWSVARERAALVEALKWALEYVAPDWQDEKGQTEFETKYLEARAALEAAQGVKA